MSGIIGGIKGSMKKKFGGAMAMTMADLGITGNSPTYNSNSSAWGWVGNGPSLSDSSSPIITIPLTGKTFTNGLRIILQAAGGASSNNDGDGDSSANSGATAVFDIPKTGLTGSLAIYIGPAGPSYSTGGGQQVNVNPRQTAGISNPLGATGVQPGQGGYCGNAAFDAAAVLSGTVIGYAEGGGATVSYDSMNGYQSRAWVNTSYVSSIATTSGPVSPGRGVAPTNTNYPSWNFNVYSDYATCYGKYGSIASSKYGQGGHEAALSSAGYNGYSGFVWVSIL
jgi:hypothetical protein